MALGKQIVYITDFNEEADKLTEHYGRTNKYSFGSSDLDTYFRGGYGRDNGYEIVVLFGSTGIGKSTFALNMLLDPLKQGKNIGLLILEDDGADVNIKMRRMLGRKDFEKYGPQLHFTPHDVVDGVKLWGLNDLLALIEDWFVTRKLDIILLDHLQFAFESAVAIKGENEYIAQRIFVRRINYLVRKLQKTIILVSHVGKDKTAKGMDRIIGSAGIAGSATKTIEVKGEKGNSDLFVRYWKSRFTPIPSHDRAFNFSENHLLIEATNKPSNQNQIPF